MIKSIGKLNDRQIAANDRQIVANDRQNVTLPKGPNSSK